MSKYVIIDAETIQKRIDELESFCVTARKVGMVTDAIDREIKTLKQILSQSTPLLPEVSKAYDAGMLHKELSQMFDYPKGRYVNNLKLDI